MRRRRTFLILFIVLILILIVGVVFLTKVRKTKPGPVPSSGTPAAEPTQEVETERIVVAVQTIPRGMRIPPDAVELRDWPVDAKDFPKEPIYDLNDVVGKVARVELPRTKPVNASQVKEVYTGEGSEFSLAIPKGKVAIALPVTVLGAVANAVRPGDRVDVLISMLIVEVDQDTQIKLPVILTGGEDCMAGCQATGDQIPRLVTQYTVQNAVVLSVGVWQSTEKPDVEAQQPAGTEEKKTKVPVVAEGEPTPVPEQQPTNVVQSLQQLTVVTLVVGPQEALVLKWAWESGASIDLVMRSAIDNDIYAQPEAVTLNYMIERYQISLPPKLPHIAENKFEYRLFKQAQETAPPPAE